MALSTDLELVASDTESDGLTHIGVMYDGAFYTLGAFKTGSHEQRKNVPTALEHAAAAAAESDSKAKGK